MLIEIWSDYACPFCYIGKKKLEKALNKFPHKDKVKIVYKSYQLNPNAPIYSELKGYEAFAKEKGVSLNQAKQMFNRVSLLAKSYDLDYQMDSLIMSNTRKAHRLAKWTNTYGLEFEFTEKLFDAYFIKTKNIADDNTLLDLIKELNLDPLKAKEILESNQFEELVELDIKEANSLGISGVPFFIFDRKFAISGAENDEYFDEALKRMKINLNEFKQIKDGENSCKYDNCAL